MKRSYLVFALLIIFVQPVFSWDEKEAKDVINHTQNILIQIDNNLELRPYIPYDIYGDALAELLQARSFYKDSNYIKSYYFAAMSSIKLETISLLAEAKKIREKIIIIERDYYKSHCGNKIYRALLNADMHKKGDSYRLIIPDKKIFQKGQSALSARGKEYLERIVEVLNNVTESTITIAGHTGQTDYKEYSRRKANSVEEYFVSRGIKKFRIKTYGLGNNEVIETPWGYRHLDCLELIISGIKDQD